jgi:hypothetical protein
METSIVRKPGRVDPRRLIVPLLAAAAGLLPAGCVHVVTYQPDAGSVGKLGADAAKVELANLFRACEKPEVTSALVEDRYVEYTWNRWYPAGLFRSVSVPYDARIYFEEVMSFRLTSNHHVRLWALEESPIADFVFPDQRTAERFLDLVTGFRDRVPSLGPPPPAAAPPAAQTAPAAPPPPAQPAAPAQPAPTAPPAPPAEPK